MILNLSDVCKVIRLYLIAQCKWFKVDYIRRYGKWAIVTGATDGIGFAMAKELARRGHSIMLIGRNETKLANCKRQIERYLDSCKQIEIVTVKIDLSDSSEENYKLIERQIEPDSRDIGLLINNAGLAPSEMKNFHEFEVKDFVQIANVNMLAMLHFTRMVLPGMIARGRGCIVNISSLLGCIENPHGNIYGPSKAFVNRFTSNLQIEYCKFPVDFINLTPGCVQTKMLHEASSSNLMNMETFLAPSAETYAKTVINAISTKIPQFSGCFGHALSKFSIKSLQILGLNRPLMRFMFKHNPCKYEEKKQLY